MDDDRLDGNDAEASAEPAAPLGRRATRGGLIALGGQIATRTIQGLALAIMAGILTPEDFGIVALTSITVLALGSIISLGLGPALQALPQRDLLDRAGLGAALIVGAGAMVVTAALSPALASLLGNADAAPYLLALTPVLLFGRWIDVRGALMERHFLFRQTQLLQVSSSVVGAIAGVAVAVSGGGAWAVVAQNLIAEGLFALALTLHPFGVHRPGFDRDSLRELWGYGRHLLGNSIVVYAYNNLDDAAVSRFLGSVQLGYYSFAYTVSNMPTYLVTGTVTRVMVPTYAAMAHRGAPWGRIYVKVLRALAWVVGAMMLALLLYGPTALGLVYGERWEGAYTAFRILCIYGLLRSVGSSTGAVFLAAGRPQLVRQIAQWQTALMVLLLVPAVAWWGIDAVAAAVTVPLAIATAYAVVRAADLAGASPRGAWSGVIGTWLAAVTGCALGLPLLWFLGGWLGLVTALSVAVAANLLYGALALRDELGTLWRHTRPSRS